MMDFVDAIDFARGETTPNTMSVTFPPVFLASFIPMSNEGLTERIREV